MGSRIRRVIGSVRLLARLVIGLLALDVLLAWGAIMGVATYVVRVWHGLAGEVLPTGTLAQHVSDLEILRALQGLVWLATAAAFLAWVHRAYRNLEILGVPDLGYSPRWAVGAFIVPILNLVHPLRVLRELWKGSDAGGPGEARPYERATPAWLLAWWLAFLTSVAADPGMLRLFAGAGPALHLGGGAQRVVIGALLEIAAGVLAIMIVSRITRGQEERLRRSARSAGPVR